MGCGVEAGASAGLEAGASTGLEAEVTAGLAVPMAMLLQPATASMTSMTSPARMLFFMVPPWSDLESGGSGAGHSGKERSCRPASDCRRPAWSAAIGPYCQRVSLRAGGRVRSMTVAAIAQAAHPAMEISAPMLGSHDACAGMASIGMVMPATPARVKKQ
jgi:hypothetical protein